MEIDFTLNPPSLQEIRGVLVQEGKKESGEYVFQCPLCTDKNKDNLHFNPKKHILKCFSCADNEGGKLVLSKINKLRWKEKMESEKSFVSNPTYRFLHKVLREQYVEYMLICNDYLLEHQELIDLLYQKRGIDRQTVIDCGIGFDDTEDHWVIPIFSLSYNGCIMGFEYRRKNFDLYPNGHKVRREKGYIADICPVWGKSYGNTLFIMEGFWDSYCMRQYLRNRGCADDYTIYSCSNGVSSLLNVLYRIDFSKFKQVKMILDADKAGDENTEKIIEQYPFIQDKRKFLFDSDTKDFNAWLLKQERR